MACRLYNLYQYPLHIDLRGGETLVLPSGATSRALLEELLYDNQHLREWEAAGWVARVPARFAETQPQVTPSDEPAGEVSKKAADVAEGETEDDPDTASAKRHRRTRP